MSKHASAINVVQYDHTMEEKYLAAMRSLITDGLSEPYSIYVYRYFLCQWAHLCYMVSPIVAAHLVAMPDRMLPSVPDMSTNPLKALDSSNGALIGAVICKLEMHSSHSPSTRRGYIAMLAVDSPHRGKGIATTLVKRAIDAMVSRDADEIVLETEETNTSAMRLYERLGFFRSKKLHRYYLNGNSAYRLVLLTKPISPDSLVDEPHEESLERNTTAIH